MRRLSFVISMALVVSVISLGAVAQAGDDLGAVANPEPTAPPGAILTPYEGWGTPVVSQPAVLVNAWISDANCSNALCPTSNAVADDFVIASTATVSTVVIPGVYAFDNLAPDVDQFTVIIHSDEEGLPGDVVYAETDVSHERIATEELLADTFEVWVYTLFLDEEIVLEPGTYWLEIFNDTGETDNTGFYWLSGTVDASATSGAALSPTAPGSEWTINDAVDVAFSLIGQSVSVGGYDATTGEWTLLLAEGSEHTFEFGGPGGIPVMGDWDGDGVDTPGLYNPLTGQVMLRNSNSDGDADLTFWFGNPGDILVAGDWTGTGTDSVGVYRPSTGEVHILDELTTEGAAPVADRYYYFGVPADKPFAGDFDGDGIDTLGLHRESTGLVYFTNGHETAFADFEFMFGDPGDRLVSGDWGRVDGIDTPAVFRPSTTTFYFRHSNTIGLADSTLEFGEENWMPVSGVFGLPG